MLKERLANTADELESARKLINLTFDESRQDSQRRRELEGQIERQERKIKELEDNIRVLQQEIKKKEEEKRALKEQIKENSGAVAVAITQAQHAFTKFVEPIDAQNAPKDAFMDLFFQVEGWVVKQLRTLNIGDAKRALSSFQRNIAPLDPLKLKEDKDDLINLIEQVENWLATVKKTLAGAKILKSQSRT